MLLFTGLRRGDAVVIGRQHVRDGVATLRTEKSQGQITVTLPILPVYNGRLMPVRLASLLLSAALVVSRSRRNPLARHSRKHV